MSQAKVMVPLAVVAIGLGAWLLMPSADTGPDVSAAGAGSRAASVYPPSERPERRTFPNEKVHKAPSAGFGPAANTPPPSTWSEARPNPAVPRDDVPRVASPRQLEAASQAADRRITMLDNMFRVAATAAPQEDRPAVQEILDGAIERMDGIDLEVADGKFGYREASQQMDQIRNEAAAEIDAILDPADADNVKLRMGIQPPPTAQDAKAWEGTPFDQSFKGGGDGGWQ